MCVLAMIIGQDGALTVAANRDESLSRPSAPPQVLDAARGIVGGKDLRSGGTWLGINRQGLFVAVTNRQEPRSTAESLSRGQLALEALRCAKLG